MSHELPVYTLTRGVEIQCASIRENEVGRAGRAGAGIQQAPPTPTPQNVMDEAPPGGWLRVPRGLFCVRSLVSSSVDASRARPSSFL